MKNSIKIICIITVLNVLLFSCKPSKVLENKIAQTIPAGYGDSKDSTNSAKINWKQFFTDSALVELIDVALRSNLDISIALQRIEAARSGFKAGKGALLPTVSGNLSYLQRKFGYYTMDDAGNRTTEIEPDKIIPTHLPDYFVGLQTSWEIDVWGKLRNKRKAAFARYLSSVEGKNAVLTNLIANVANDYYSLLAMDNQLEIVRESIKLQENALELLKIQKQAAAVNELAVQQFQAELLNSKALEFEILQEILETETEINFLLGRYPQPINRDKSRLNQSLPIKASVGIPSDLLKFRPDIRQAEFELVAAKADRNAAKAAFYPSLNITGSLGFQGYKAALLFSNPQSMAYSLFGSLITPLINRSAIKAEFNTASAFQLEALYNYQKSILNGYVEVYNEVARIRSLESMINLKTQEADILSQAIETSAELFKTGRANYIEVLMTQKSSLEAKIDLIDARERQFNSVINLYKALGGGWQ